MSNGAYKIMRIERCTECPYRVESEEQYGLACCSANGGKRIDPCSYENGFPILCPLDSGIERSFKYE